MEASQRLQSDEYSFPYHYLMDSDGLNYSSFKAWGWSLSYATALKLVADKLVALRPRNYIDIGCGDGALVSHMHRALPHAHVEGVDYDPRAIAFANLFNPDVEFTSGDITTMNWPRPFDAATLIEVIEHIPLDAVPGFMRGVRNMMGDDGTLIVTVPHANKPVEEKHFRHFTFATLAEVLEEHFEVQEMFGFERRRGIKNMLHRFTSNRFVFAEFPMLNRYLLTQELAFRTKGEDGCGRILAVARCRSRPN